jgi:octopine/nopaline transport system ATP-binding protein
MTRKAIVESIGGLSRPLSCPLSNVRTTAAGESRRPLAPEVSSRAIFLHAGRIEEEGPPNQVFGDPLTERCRAFVARHFNR